MASSSLSLESLALPSAAEVGLAVAEELSPPAAPGPPSTPKDEVLAAFAAGLTRQRLTPEQQRQRECQARHDRSEHKQALRQHLGTAILLHAKAYAVDDATSPEGAASVAPSWEPLGCAAPRDSPVPARGQRCGAAAPKVAWTGAGSVEAAPGGLDAPGALASTPAPRFLRRAGRSSTDDVEVDLHACRSGVRGIHSRGRAWHDHMTGDGSVRSPGKPPPAAPPSAVQPGALVQL